MEIWQLSNVHCADMLLALTSDRTGFSVLGAMREVYSCKLVGAHIGPALTRDRSVFGAMREVFRQSFRR